MHRNNQKRKQSCNFQAQNAENVFAALKHAAGALPS